MASLFLKLLNMSIAASWLILAVIVLRVLLKRAPKWIHCILWALVGIRLLCPISIESALSLIPSSEPLPPEVVQFAPHPAINSGITIIDNAVNPVMGETFAASPVGGVNPLYAWTYLASIVWLIGVIALVIYAVISYLRLRRVVCEAVRQRNHLYLCDHIQTPFILGLLHPRIYLPSDMNEAQMQSVIAHEQAHLSRHDHWWKPLGWAILTVYWFNPFCWVAYILLCRDIELACDEKVICNMDVEAKKAYSMALLSCSIPRRLISACPLAFGEVGVKERIKGVLHYKKPAFWVVAVAVITCVVAAVCFLTNPKEAEKAEMDDPTEPPMELSEEEWDSILRNAEPYYPQNTATVETLVVSADSMGEILCDRTLPSGIRIVCYCDPDSEDIKYWAVWNGDSLTRFCQEDSGYRESYDVEPFSGVLGQSGFRILAPRGSAYFAYDYYVMGENGVPQLLAECANQVEEVDVNHDGEMDLRWYYHGGQEIYYYFRQNGQLYFSGSVPPAVTQATSCELMGMAGWYQDDERSDTYFIQRTYFTRSLDGTDLPIAQSFGYAIDDYIVDLDGDGVPELVCNCQYGGDGHESVYVYRRNGAVIERGWLNWDASELDDFNDWGVATREYYDPETGFFMLDYDTNRGSFASRAYHYLDFKFEEYAQVPKQEQVQTPITADNLFASLPGTFHFLSGAGGWQTELYWNGDGTFSGIYEDADVSEIYRCFFTGSTNAPQRIGDLEFSTRVTALDYDKSHAVTYENGQKVISAGPYGLDDVDEIRIYLPGYPVSKLPIDALNWLRGGAEEFWDGQGPETLPFFVLYNVRGQQAFFSADWSAFSGTSSSRPERMDLTFVVEGLEEPSIPAYLFRDLEYSLYIPHDGWQYHRMLEHDLLAKCWTSTINPDVSLTVRHLGYRNLVEAQEWEREQNAGFQLIEDKRGGIGGTDSTGKSMLEVFFYSGQNAMYAVELRYPVEAIEGFGTRLHVIQDTFQVSNSRQWDAQN